MSKEVIAIACADIHLSHIAPACRAGEKDWYEAMSRPLKELKGLAKKHRVPILCAGDVFHHWKAPPELINFAADNLPTMYSIPGQHDMPYHSPSEMEKSAYNVLTRLGALVPLPKEFMNPDGFIFYAGGFGWGEEVRSPTTKRADSKVCLHHAYRWQVGSGHVQAAPEHRIGDTEKPPKEYQGYNTVIIGDNHKSWDKAWLWDEESYCYLFNCGSLMRRSSDQLNHRPRVGLIKSDGTVDTHYLDTSADVFEPTSLLSPEDALSLDLLKQGALEVAAFAELQRQIDRLDEPGVDQMGFYDALRIVLTHKGLKEGARKVIKEALEHGRQKLPR